MQSIGFGRKQPFGEFTSKNLWPLRITRWNRMIAPINVLFVSIRLVNGFRMSVIYLVPMRVTRAENAALMI